MVDLSELVSGIGDDPRLIRVTACEDRPGDARKLVGERDCQHVALKPLRVSRWGTTAPGRSGDPGSSPADQFAAAKAAAPFCHPQLQAVAHKHSDASGRPIASLIRHGRQAKCAPRG